MIITNTLAAMSILVPFYYSIGMNQAQIGLSQAIFTIVMLLLNVPTGWLADRFSRKLSNFAGDALAATGLVYYSMAQGFADVLAAELILGIGGALSMGADGALLRSYVHKLGFGSNGYANQLAKVVSWRPIAQIVALSIGGYIGATEPRLAILLSALPFAVGAILSLFLQESGERLIVKHRNPFKDMVELTKDSLRHNPKLRWSIIAYAVGREVTHPTVWVLTPALLLVGVPAQVVTLGWVLNLLAVALGARLAGKWSQELREWQRFALPLVTVLVTFSVMSAHLSLGTIWLYAAVGLAQGWASATLLPIVQRQTPPDRQATVISVTVSTAQLLYIPLVWIVNAVGVADIRLSLAAVVAIFAPLALVTAWKLASFDKEA